MLQKKRKVEIVVVADVIVNVTQKEPVGKKIESMQCKFAISKNVKSEKETVDKGTTKRKNLQESKESIVNVWWQRM